MRSSRFLGGAVFGLVASIGVVLFAFAAEKTEGPSELYKEYCSRCHGDDGKGQTPKGKQLSARDFTDQQWQSEKTDADLIKTVTRGGEDMPTFGKTLSREQIEDLVKNDVRGFGRKK